MIVCVCVHMCVCSLSLRVCVCVRALGSPSDNIPSQVAPDIVRILTPRLWLQHHCSRPSCCGCSSARCHTCAVCTNPQCLLVCVAPALNVLFAAVRVCVFNSACGCSSTGSNHAMGVCTIGNAACVPVCLCACMSVCLCSCMSVCVYVCVRVCL